MFIKAEDSETKEGLKVEEAIGERKEQGALETGSGGTLEFRGKDSRNRRCGCALMKACSGLSVC